MFTLANHAQTLHPALNFNLMTYRNGSDGTGLKEFPSPGPHELRNARREADNN